MVCEGDEKEEMESEITAAQKLALLTKFDTKMLEKFRVRKIGLFKKNDVTIENKQNNCK